MMDESKPGKGMFGKGESISDISAKLEKQKNDYISSVKARFRLVHKENPNDQEVAWITHQIENMMTRKEEPDIEALAKQARHKYSG